MERRMAREEWQTANEMVLAKERHMTQLEVLAARGEVPAADMQRLHTDLEVLRKLTDTLFTMAFQ
jgi:hypothetical protein